MTEQRRSTDDGRDGPRFIARAIDYMFGRNSLIGLASLMLLVISGYATWHGMNDFIIGASGSKGSEGTKIVGGVSITNDVLVISIVVALTFLMWLCLREAFGAKRRLTERILTGALYLFLALWSIGFGYGFWWSLIAGEEATRSSFANLQEDASAATQAIAARIDAVKGQIDSVVAWSDGQMAREESSGGSCGTPSGAGRGPLYNARRSVRDTIVVMRDSFVNNWLTPVRVDLEQLKITAGKLEAATVAERQRLFEQAASDIRAGARNIATRSNEVGKATAAEMRALADSVRIPPKSEGFSCYDPTLAQRLKQAADQAVEPAVIVLRDASFNEGPAGVANAVKNLWANLAGGLTQFANWVTGTPSDGTPAQPISGRDLIALLATIGIDLGLFVLTVLNPPREPPPVRPSPMLIRQINDAINAAVARAPNADIEWLLRHFVHHNKASFFVIPNLYAADESITYEPARASAINQLAGVLSDLDLVRWPNAKEFKKFAEDEVSASATDLVVLRKKWIEKQEADKRVIRADAEKWKAEADLRNHGLLSKAERALQIAGWSEKARRDPEIFTIVDADGLTPLLMVLSEAALPERQREEPVATTPA